MIRIIKSGIHESKRCRRIFTERAEEQEYIKVFEDIADYAESQAGVQKAFRHGKNWIDLSDATITTKMIGIGGNYPRLLIDIRTPDNSIIIGIYPVPTNNKYNWSAYKDSQFEASGDTSGYDYDELIEALCFELYTIFAPPYKMGRGNDDLMYHNKDKHRGRNESMRSSRKLREIISEYADLKTIMKYYDIRGLSGLRKFGDKHDCENYYETVSLLASYYLADHPDSVIDIPGFDRAGFPDNSQINNPD